MKERIKRRKKMEKVYHLVSEEEAGIRIDKLLTTVDEEWSRTQIQEWIKSEHVLVNGKKVKANYKCEVNDKIIVNIPEPVPLNIEAEEMDLDIVYEDSDVIVVNKPRGMV